MGDARGPSWTRWNRHTLACRPEASPAIVLPRIGKRNAMTIRRYIGRKAIKKKINGLRSYLNITLDGPHWSTDVRRMKWPGAPDLDERHLRHCRVVPNRIVLLDHMPKDAVCAEVGILRCAFSKCIME